MIVKNDNDNKKIKNIIIDYDHVKEYFFSRVMSETQRLCYTIPFFPSVTPQGKYYQDRGIFPTSNELEEFGPDIKICVFEKGSDFTDIYQIIPLKKVQKSA